MSRATREIGKDLGRLVPVLGLATLASCRMLVGPDYEEPSVELPDTWMASAKAEDATPLSGAWWLLLEDETLSRLVDLVLAGSPSLEESFARWQESLAARGIATADRYPTIDVRNERRRERTSEAFGPGGGRTQETYGLSLDASFEPDLFGRIRRNIEAADADIEASREDLEALRLTLAADAAASYIDLRTTTVQLDLARTNLAIQKETLELVEAQRASGLADQLSVDRARADAAETEARLPQLEAEIGALSRQLAVLAGCTYPELPEHVRAALEGRAEIPAAPPLPLLSAPSEVARERPDVRRLERQLAAQTARVGVAEADLYPSLTIFGSAGLSAPELDSLLESSSRTWSLAPRLSWNVLGRERIHSRVRIEEHRVEQARARFDRAVLEAWDEVEDFALRYGREEVRLDQLEEAVDSSGRAVELAREQYAAGLVDLQVVLDTQRVLIGVTDQLAVSRGTLTKNWIALGRSLGVRTGEAGGEVSAGP